MQAKKINIQNHKANQLYPNGSPDSHLQDSPLGCQSRGRQLHSGSPSYPSHRIAHSKSGSKARRNSSKNKLFEKAHQTSEGETYLKDIKNQCTLSAGQTTRSSPKGKTSPDKPSTLSLHKELDLKINGCITDQQSSFSKLIMQFGCEDVFLDVDLSSIKQDGYQTGSDLQISESLLRGISAN